MNKKFILMSGIGSLLSWASQAGATVLYDGVSTSPVKLMNDAAWNWFYGQSPSGAANPASTNAVGTVLDTTIANAPTYAGFNSSHDNNTNISPPAAILKNPAMPVLDRATGYKVLFNVDVNGETHSSSNRSGFSVIVQSADLLGVELAFWPDHVWAYDVGFTHSSDDAAFITDGSGPIPYELTVLGSNFTLKSNSTTLINNGALRNYSAFGFPYNTPSWIFMGRDSSEGTSSVVISHVEVIALPEPSSVGLLGSAGLFLLQRRRVAGKHRVMI